MTIVAINRKSEAGPRRERIDAEADLRLNDVPRPAAKSSAWFELIKLLRPKQWLKNCFCLAGVMLTGHSLDVNSILLALATMAVFSLSSSSVYVCNDILDRDRDRLHPKKRNRPLARGTVSVRTALLTAIFLASFSLVSAFWLSPTVFFVVLLQIANTTLYSLYFKHQPILDVISIALGFVLRMIAGVYVLDELPTTWITLCTFFLALFLGFGKRRAELDSMELETASVRRPVLTDYSVGYLDNLVNATAVMAILCYAMSTTTGDNPALVLTVPIVFFAIAHYKRLLMVCKGGEEPEDLAWRDSVLKFSVTAWLLAYSVISTFKLDLFR